MNHSQVEMDRLFEATEAGDRRAASALFELVYQELRRLASKELQKEAAAGTLQTTALVNEAWLKLVGNNRDPKWNSRDHFLMAAASAMRRILVDAARARQRLKRGGDKVARQLVEEDCVQSIPDDELLALNDALEELAAQDPVKADLVNLRYFVGMTNAEACRYLHISTATGERYWAYTRAWLRRKMEG